MVFTSRIEVFGVKPDFRFSFIINQFHNDLFLKGLLYFHKTHSCIFERTIFRTLRNPIGLRRGHEDFVLRAS